MPYVLIAFGTLLAIAGFQNTYKELGAIIADEFTDRPDSRSFFYWMMAIIILGGLGYIPALRAWSKAFVLLILVGLFFSPRSNMQQWFEKFNAALSAGSKTPVNPAGGGVQYQDSAQSSGGAAASATDAGSAGAKPVDNSAANDAGKAGTAMTAVGGILVATGIGAAAGAALIAAGAATTAGAAIARK